MVAIRMADATGNECRLPRAAPFTISHIALVVNMGDATAPLLSRSLNTTQLSRSEYLAVPHILSLLLLQSQRSYLKSNNPFL